MSFINNNEFLHSNLEIPEDGEQVLLFFVDNLMPYECAAAVYMIDNENQWDEMREIKYWIKLSDLKKLLGI